MIIGEESNYEAMKKDNFSLLDEVRKISQENDNTLTVSIGIGKGNTTSILRTSELSYAALNMALSRGGDQVAVYVFGSALQTYGTWTSVMIEVSGSAGNFSAVLRMARSICCNVCSVAFI